MTQINTWKAICSCCNRRPVAKNNNLCMGCSKVKDISGTKFNYLTPIQFLYTRKHMTIWLCRCDCGKFLTTNSQGIQKGTVKSCGCKRKGINLSEKNGVWAGDKVKYRALHNWVQRHHPKPSKCQICGEVKKLDSANISQLYKRELKDWEYLCRKCHMIKDGRMEKFLTRN